MLWSITKGIHPLTSDHAGGSGWTSSRSAVFLKLTPDQILIFDWIAGSSQVRHLNINEAQFFTCSLSNTAVSQKGILPSANGICRCTVDIDPKPVSSLILIYVSFSFFYVNIVISNCKYKIK